MPTLPARFIEPMFLQQTARLPEGAQWLYELKLDGYRALAIKSGGKVNLRSRNDNDFNARYLGIVKALAPMPDDTVRRARSGQQALPSPYPLLRRLRRPLVAHLTPRGMLPSVRSLIDPVDPRFCLAPGKKHLARRCADDCNR
jgi:hypothetical protein